MKTRKGIWKLVDIRDIWKKLTDPEKDDEFEEVNDQDTDKFIRNLRNIQIKTSQIQGIPSGLVFPFGFGMSLRLTLLGV